MAVSDYDQLTSITREKILPNISDAITKKSPALNRFFSKAKRLDGGKTIDKVVYYAHDTQGGGYAGLDVLDAGQATNRTRASFVWRQVYQPVVVSNIDIAKNGGEAKVLDLVAQEMEGAKKSLQNKFMTYIYGDGTGNASTVPDGLISAVDDGTNQGTYGGIVRSTYTWWKGSYAASAGAFAVSTLSTRLDDIELNGEAVDLHLTHPSEWTQYEQTLHPQARFEFNTNGYPKADGGFPKLVYRGVEVLKDQACTNGYWYMLNTDTIDFYYLKHPDHSTDSRGLTYWPLHQPPTQDGKIGFFLWYGNFICTNPRHNGVIRGLT